ncbi:MAG: cobalamin-dependent protein [Candidatus Thermoplasmatota archaeon]|nr:cobalamin-dependent protein [Candidatus Thermoplasmatota archaeon]
MSSDKILKDLQKSVLGYDSAAAVSAARAVIATKMDPLLAIEKGLVPAIEEVGEKFEKMELYLPELMLAGDAMRSALALLLPLLPKGSRGYKATAVIGTVQGDVHEIGKNIVASLMLAGGYNVIDLGVDVKTIAFVEEARKAGARIIGASALMSSTIGSQKDIVDYLVSSGDRKKFVVLVGGGPTTKEWAKEIGADGCGMTAVEAVKLADKFVKGR